MTGYYLTAEPVGCCSCPRCNATEGEGETQRGGPVSLGVTVAELKALLEARRAGGVA